MNKEGGKGIVGSAILIPSAPPQNVVHPADCSVWSRRVFHTTSFARTCSADAGHTKEIHPFINIFVQFSICKIVLKQFNNEQKFEFQIYI